VHATGLKGDGSKMVMVRLSKPRPEVGNDTQQRIAGVETRLRLQAREAVRVLDRQHERVHEVLGGVVDADEQAVLLAVDEDHLAVDAQEPAPLGGELDGDLEPRFGARSEFEHPAVEREARHGFPQPLLEHGGEDPVGRQPLYVDPHRLVNEVVGEAPPWPGALAFERERGAARVAQKALERLKGTARARRSSRGLAVTFGVQARALSGNGHGVFPTRSPLSGRLPDK
jgi:hypothetical protein